MIFHNKSNNMNQICNIKKYNMIKIYNKIRIYNKNKMKINKINLNI